MTYDQVGAKVVAEVAGWVQTLGVPFIVVGGSAIARRYQVRTNEVDFLVLVGGWNSLDAAVEKDGRATALEPDTGSIRGTTVTLGARRIFVEFISGEVARGTRSADEYVAYVRSRWSRDVNGIRYAEPAVVFYMRLAGDEWADYVQAFHRDLGAGVPADTFDRAIRIARHLGVEEKIRGRVRTIRTDLLRLFGPRRE